MITCTRNIKDNRFDIGQKKSKEKVSFGLAFERSIRVILTTKKKGN